MGCWFLTPFPPPPPPQGTNEMHDFSSPRAISQNDSDLRWLIDNRSNFMLNPYFEIKLYKLVLIEPLYRFSNVRIIYMYVVGKNYIQGNIF